MKDVSKIILQLLSGAVLALFTVIWAWIGFKLLFFHPTKQTPNLSFTESMVTVAGFLASAVGAGTASVLGIEIANVQRRPPAQNPQPPAQNNKRLFDQVNDAAANSILLTTGILLYAIVGIFVLLVWVFSSYTSPDMIAAFALGVLGWLGGALAAVFRTSTQA